MWEECSACIEIETEGEEEGERENEGEGERIGGRENEGGGRAGEEERKVGLGRLFRLYNPQFSSLGVCVGVNDGVMSMALCSPPSVCFMMLRCGVDFFWYSFFWSGEVMMAGPCAHAGIHHVGALDGAVSISAPERLTGSAAPRIHWRATALLPA